MIRHLLLILSCLLALACSFTAGAVVAVEMNWGKPHAVIVIENQSSKDIALIELFISTCGTRRTITQKSTDVQPYASSLAVSKFIVPLCGEGGYRTRIQFSDGSTASSPGSYIMNGSRAVERIQADSIQSYVPSIAY